MSGRGVEGVCVFGSAARGSGDDYSDRDVLIVSSDRRRRDRMTSAWRAHGWSVAAYTPSRLRKMANAKSLFVQHLKLEGIVTRDRGRWLRGLLDGAEPKDSYAADAAMSVELALPIERFEAEAPIRDRLATADMGYVAARNFGICHLADSGRLSFDYNRIVSRLADDFDLDRRETDLLLSLRAGKTAYRRGAPCGGVVGSVGELRSVLSRFFPSRPLGQIDGSAPPRKLAGGYATLRDYEAAAVVKSGPRPTGAELAALRADPIWKWVCDPRAYAWNIRAMGNGDPAAEALCKRFGPPQAPRSASLVGTADLCALSRPRRSAGAALVGC